MKLTKIKIENYRSIKYLDFDFQKITGASEMNHNPKHLLEVEENAVRGN